MKWKGKAQDSRGVRSARSARHARVKRPVSIRRLRCRLLNGKRCGFVATGRTAWEVKKAMFDHHAKEHKELLLHAGPKDLRRTMDMMDRLMDKGGNRND